MRIQISHRLKFWGEDAAENPLGGSRAQHTAAPAGCRPTQNLHVTLIMPNSKSDAQNFNFTHSFRVKMLYIYISNPSTPVCPFLHVLPVTHTHTHYTVSCRCGLSFLQSHAVLEDYTSFVHLLQKNIYKNAKKTGGILFLRISHRYAPSFKPNSTSMF